ncbi:hypothetical protein OGATHE_006295 [Ogataea polymorpha]|uniref:Uncharacterized protein n=1 Tax=Ogataea polymorpha TaxID=460523 RepID=A0A9P8NUD6_9ASCO|nr:hypothetical protein OGATHE_006295 [Ogataea polymorpha]
MMAPANPLPPSSLTPFPPEDLSNNVDSGDLLSDGVLDLDSRVDFDEIMSVLVVNKELCSTSVSVVGSLSQFHCVSQNGVSDLDRKRLGWGNLNHLLVSSLHGTVSFKKVDNVAVVVGQQLHLNVLWLVQKPLNETGTVSKSGLGFGGGSLESVSNALALANHSHTTSTSTKSGLDNHWIAILIHKLLGLLNAVNWAVCSRDHGNVALAGQVSGTDLVSNSVNDVVGRANPNHATVLNFPGKF